MATADRGQDETIVWAEFRFPSLVGDRAEIVVKLGDGTVRRLLDWPVVELKLRERNLIGRTIDSARAQVECWRQAAQQGIHRIVYVEKIRRIPRRHRRLEPNGDWEVVAFMSDGTSVRVFAFYNDEISFRKDEFLDLYLEQARELKVQRDIEQVPDGFNDPDYSKVHSCPRCGTVH